jgi:hypothetical protein
MMEGMMRSGRHIPHHATVSPHASPGRIPPPSPRHDWISFLVVGPGIGVVNVSHQTLAQGEERQIFGPRRRRVAPRREEEDVEDADEEETDDGSDDGDGDNNGPSPTEEGKSVAAAARSTGGFVINVIVDVDAKW